uniref:Syndecan binding protein 2 n=1 Tax=Canis lupus familiaris TaxID=9615 RepID=A0A8C0MIS1_CANLF
MSTLYPSLEDLKMDQAIQAQARAAARMPALPVSQPSVLYPSLADLENYMGLSLSSQEVQQNLLQLPEGAGMVGSGLSPGQLVAPLSGNSLGTRRAEIKPGVREIYLCKDEHGKTGLRLRAIDQGLFVQLVKANSPASLVGLRFGDQILQIDGRDCAGWSTDRAHRVLKRASAEKIAMVVRDRPFQRTVTMHKDSTGHVGFVIKKGAVVSVVRGSSAARNGLLTKQSVCEVNGQNVVGLKVGALGRGAQALRGGQAAVPLRLGSPRSGCCGLSRGRWSSELSAQHPSAGQCSGSRRPRRAGQAVRPGRGCVGTGRPGGGCCLHGYLPPPRHFCLHNWLTFHNRNILENCCSETHFFFFFFF